MKKHPSKKKRNSKVRLKFFSISIGLGLGVILAIILHTRLQVRPPCANSISCISDLSGDYKKADNGVFLGRKVAVPHQVSYPFNLRNVLGEQTGLPKRIEVNLSDQMLYAYEGNTVVLNFPISSGKWSPTPTGEFNIWIKLRYTKMEGGNKANNTYYYLPNVPYTMYFYNEEVPKIRGYGLHGAYWHTNFGHPMSHGCINISPENAGLLYNWANPYGEAGTTLATSENPGTKVVIYGVAPRE